MISRAQSEPPRNVVESVLDNIVSGFPYDVAETCLLPSLIDLVKD